MVEKTHFISLCSQHRHSLSLTKTNSQTEHGKDDSGRRHAAFLYLTIHATHRFLESNGKVINYLFLQDHSPLRAAYNGPVLGRR